MRMKKLLAVAQKTWIPCLLFLFVCCQAQELPGTVRMTPVKETKLVPVKLIVPEKFKGMISDDLVLNVPEGYTAKVFYTGGLSKARFFAWGPDSVLYVANKNSGEIIAMPDRNHDGVADTGIVVASGFHKSHDLKFYQGAMYVAEERRIMKCTDENGDGIYETKKVFIDEIGKGSRQPEAGMTHAQSFLMLRERKCTSQSARPVTSAAKISVRSSKNITMTAQAAARSLPAFAMPWA